MVTASKYGPERPPYFDTFQAMVGVIRVVVKKGRKRRGKVIQVVLSITKCVLQTIRFLVYFCKLLSLFAIISLSVLCNELGLLKKRFRNNCFPVNFARFF